MIPPVIHTSSFSRLFDQVVRFFLTINGLQGFSPLTRCRPGGVQVDQVEEALVTHRPIGVPWVPARGRRTPWRS